MALRCTSTFLFSPSFLLYLEEVQGIINEVLERIKKLEESQKASVDSTLRELRLLMKAPVFTKDQALDYLLNIRMVAKESNHPNAGFYEAVLRALREKSRVPYDQFKRYLDVLLGDKDHEKVLEMMSKVDKLIRSSVSALLVFLGGVVVVAPLVRFSVFIAISLGITRVPALCVAKVLEGS